MKSLLHIIASPRGAQSRSNRIAAAFLAETTRRRPALHIDTLNVFDEPLPALTAVRVGGKYQLMAGQELNAAAEKSWKAIVAQITRFLAADAYLISTPMWNFGVPYALKHYLDVIVQPKHLFRYTEQGPVGLALNKRMLVVSARGGDYSIDSPYHACDFVEPYLRTVFGFVGISDLTFVNAQPLDAGDPQVTESKLAEAETQARAIAVQWCS